MRIGIISPKWLPHHGGQPQYAHRLALALEENGLEVFVFSATAAIQGKDHGQCKTTRWSAQGPGNLDSWKRAADANDVANPNFGWIYAFMNAAADWADSLDLDVAIIDAPLTFARFHQLRELYKHLKARDIKVGAIYHDLHQPVVATLVREYRKARNWRQADDTTRDIILRTAEKIGVPQAYHFIGSPLFFEPDFVVTSSTWTAAFIDPFGTLPKFAMHPFLDSSYWSQSSASPSALTPKDILMVNPLFHKGSKHMADLIASADRHWSFRVLKGGYGNSFQNFVPLIAATPAAQEGRMELLDYVPDMRDAYRASEVLFFPSLHEGYGMTAVEPMFLGVNVVSSNYPAIIEAVGDGAATLCPYFSTPEEWHAAVADAMKRKSYWRARGARRTAALIERQKQEVREMIRFIAAA